MKKGITVLFLLVVALCGATGAFAQSESDFICTAADGKVTIKNYTGRGGRVVIPATMMGGLPVTEIGDFAFYECTGLTLVNIPYGVTGIGTMAFYGCTNLSSVSIPGSVTGIGNMAFSACTDLTSVSIPASVTSVGTLTFDGCSGLTGISVDPNNTAYTSRDGVLFSKAGDVLFVYPARKKGQYEVPVGVNTIEINAFSGCSGLTSVSIPESVTNFRGLLGYTSLADISIDSRNTSYSSRDGVLFNKAGDTLIRCPAGKKEKQYAIPEGVTTIESCAFGYCTGLTSVSIPDGVTEIGTYAFEGCTGLTAISIPASVTMIGSFAFDGLTGSIRIGANVEISHPFDMGYDPFSKYYIENGSRAGVYTFRRGKWSYTER